MRRSFKKCFEVKMFSMLTTDEVKHIALLSRIGLNEVDIPTYQKDLSAVLDFFRELEKLPTDNVAPIGHITVSCVMICMRNFSRKGRYRYWKTLPIQRMISSRYAQFFRDI